MARQWPAAERKGPRAQGEAKPSALERMHDEGPGELPMGAPSAPQQQIVIRRRSSALRARGQELMTPRRAMTLESVVPSPEGAFVPSEDVGRAAARQRRRSSDDRPEPSHEVYMSGRHSLDEGARGRALIKSGRVVVSSVHMQTPRSIGNEIRAASKTTCETADDGVDVPMWRSAAASSCADADPPSPPPQGGWFDGDAEQALRCFEAQDAQEARRRRDATKRRMSKEQLDLAFQEVFESHPADDAANRGPVLNDDFMPVLSLPLAPPSPRLADGEDIVPTASGREGAGRGERKPLQFVLDGTFMGLVDRQIHGNDPLLEREVSRRWAQGQLLHRRLHLEVPASGQGEGSGSVCSTPRADEPSAQRSSGSKEGPSSQSQDPKTPVSTESHSKTNDRFNQLVSRVRMKVRAARELSHGLRRTAKTLE
eukprot:CAMPEP_0170254536 /NCGR_PEP_ID=MMETSP0116_2-20130129/27115_1 /TAXON_ID=400756 /ORGANISM="Durinskia baltica, Strain CSIRO CS-38" /LENGTH=425 /DNA_ID=CAMNT_0010505533 /DNA_START=12 /DNA_END=1289 /DNA_ORIENTATION=+